MTLASSLESLANLFGFPVSRLILSDDDTQVVVGGPGFPAALVYETRHGEITSGTGIEINKDEVALYLAEWARLQGRDRRPDARYILHTIRNR